MSLVELLNQVLCDLFQQQEKVIISSQEQSLVEEQLAKQGVYTPPECVHLSYKYIEKFYGVRPIFGFCLSRDNYDVSYLDEVLSHMPSTGSRVIYIMAYNPEAILFEGEYYNWADFHGFVNDVLGKVPETQDSVYFEWSICEAEDDLGLPDDLIKTWSSKEGFERDINTSPCNLTYASQVIMRCFKSEDILQRLAYSM